ncbi:MAG: aminotransferase class IV, partial [Gammaproteobacteria bacterium]|nr:aminotransferase class IV [Gammaproteobacteria bacterium]
YGLTFNNNKCESLTINGHDDIHFKDGTRVPKQNEVKYLGCMLNDRGDVVCGTMTNLFLVSGGGLLTPDLGECGVRGVMRDRVIRVAEQNNISVAELRVSRTNIENAEDMFLTNSLIGVWPVAELDGQTFTRSALTLRLMQLLADAGVTECAV